jgi:hypothetical protein
MTTQEKNLAIAEMLGAKVEPWLEIQQPYYKGTIYNPLIEGDWCCGMKDKDECLETLGRHAKYDSDANWQFYALEWIEARGHPIYIVKTDVVIKSNGTISTPSVWNGTQHRFPNKKEAIFEALFQFSQYLKKQT